VLALWNVKPRFRKTSVVRMSAVPRRISLAAGFIGMPESFAGFEAEHADAVYLAAAAHAGAHLIHSGVQFPAGKLKPVQIALASLIEDARVEALALRDLPGLRRLWMPFHTVSPASQTTAARLMMRLSRALLDPTYDDPDAWVSKGRALFAATADRIGDPAISREIGGLLGNDLGQMRLQFNANSYVVEPVYRDDWRCGISATRRMLRPMRSNSPWTRCVSSGVRRRAARHRTITRSVTKPCARGPAALDCSTAFRSRPIPSGTTLSPALRRAPFRFFSASLALAGGRSRAYVQQRSSRLPAMTEWYLVWVEGLRAPEPQKRSADAFWGQLGRQDVIVRFPLTKEEAKLSLAQLARLHPAPRD
jgi:hypothetical protein